MLIKYTNFIKLSFVALLREAFGHSSTPADYRYLPNDNDPNCKLRIYRAFPQRMFKAPAIVISADPGNAQLRYFDDEKVADIYRVHDEEVVSSTLAVYPIFRVIELKDDANVPYIEGTHFTLDKPTGVLTWIVTEPTKYFATYDTLKFVNRTLTVLQARHVQSMLQVPVTMTVYAMRTTDRERLTDLLILYLRHVFRDAFKPLFTYADIKLGGENETTWDNQPLFTNTVTVDIWSQYANEIDYGLYDLINNINVQVAVKGLGVE